MNDNSAYQFQYYEGFFSFRNEQVEVLMDEETFDAYVHAYLVMNGMDTRSDAELLAAATKAQLQRKEAEKVLMNPEYWLAISDPNVRIIQQNPLSQ